MIGSKEEDIWTLQGYLYPPFLGFLGLTCRITSGTIVTGKLTATFVFYYYFCR